MKSAAAAVMQGQEAEQFRADQRVRDPLNELGRRMNHACTTAVDPLQIAAALEADGIIDANVHDEYGLRDIFELAEQLYRRVPRRVQAAALAAPRMNRRWPEISHGLLFALPGLFYPAAVSLTRPGTATLAIVAAVVAGWAWSQVMIYVAHLLQGRQAHSDAAGWLRLSAVIGLGSACLLAAVLAWHNVDYASLQLIALGQLTYQLAAAVIIMLEREELLLAALLPGTISNLLHLLFPAQVSAPAAIAGSIISVLITAGVAASITFRPRKLRSATPSVTRQDLLLALPYLLYGLLCALLVSFDTLRFWRSFSATGLGLTIAPLVLSKGFLEWQLRSYRLQVAQLLSGTHTEIRFQRAAMTAFLGRLAGYALLLALLSLAALPFVLSPESESRLLITALLANWLLGCAFFISFALIAQGRIVLVNSCLFIALALHAFGVGSGLVPAAHPHLAAITSYAVCCLILALLLAGRARPVLCQIRHYRWDLEATNHGRNPAVIPGRQHSRRATWQDLQQ